MCSVVVLYDGYPKPVFVGVTRDQRVLVLVKRQLLQEARAALQEAKQLGDDVLIASFSNDLGKLQETLDLLIPQEIEHLYGSEHFSSGRE